MCGRKNVEAQNIGDGASRLPTSGDGETRDSVPAKDVLPYRALHKRLLKEAESLLDQLERDRDSNSRKKTRLEHQITETRSKMDKHGSMGMKKDTQCITLVQDLDHLMEDIQEIKKRLSLLGCAVSDLRDVICFIREQELSSEYAWLLVEKIMKQMFKDLKLTMRSDSTSRETLPESVSLLNKPERSLIKSKSANMTRRMRHNDVECMPGSVTGTEWHDHNSHALDDDENRRRFRRASMKFKSATEFARSRTMSMNHQHTSSSGIGLSPSLMSKSMDTSLSTTKLNWTDPQMEANDQEQGQEILKTVDPDTWTELLA